ncbi:SRPBCC domain-containing protein [bacterium]|nr:SRPBCC domain-containing protein [bacterium]
MSTAYAETEPFEINGFSITQTVTVPGTPMDAFNTFTGDIKPWWDHSMSENPDVLRIDPYAGGQFYEKMSNGQGTVEHARVIFAMPGKLLRLHGPFGLSGLAVDMVSTITFAPVSADGEEVQPGASGDVTSDSTRVTVEGHIVGQIDTELAEIVDGVWHHFLTDRLKPYMEGTLEN